MPNTTVNPLALPAGDLMRMLRKSGCPRMTDETLQRLVDDGLPLNADGGSSTTYLCDSVYNDAATGARVIYRGGQQSAGGAAGMGCVYLLGERSVSLKYAGGRLAC